MSKIEVNTVDAQCGSTITIGSAGKTVNVPGTALTSTIVKTNTLQAADGGNIVNQCGTTITLGATGDAIALAGGATQTGFGREGSVDWDTTPKTGTVTAATGKGYFVNTTSGGITVNLPAGAAGSIVAVSDYTRTFGTNSCTVAPNGAEKMGGIAASVTLSVDGQSATFVYVDGTEGWINVQETQTSQAGAVPFDVEYQVVAGGAGGGGSGGGPGSGGGGAGGFRIRYDSPLNAPADLTLFAGIAYPITVGGGGSAGTSGSRTGGSGNDSVFSSITSAGGGGGAGAGCVTSPPALAGGSGGGGSYQCSPPTGRSGGAGNTPPVSPPQGNAGQDGQNGSGRGDGGGGAGAVGNSGSGNTGGTGGVGLASCISGSSVTKAVGGTGGSYNSPNQTAGAANSGTGGSGSGSSSSGGGGGSGIVYVRYPTSGAPPTVAQSGGSSAPCGSDTVVTYTGPGSFTA